MSCGVYVEDPQRAMESSYRVVTYSEPTAKVLCDTQSLSADKRPDADKRTAPTGGMGTAVP